MLLALPSLLTLFQLYVGDGNTQQFRVPYAHISVLSLLDYMMEHQGYREFISLGRDGWETRLRHAIALISTVYHSALLKLKAGPGWESANVAFQEKQHYDEAVKRLFSASEPEASTITVDQLLHGLCRALLARASS